MSYICSGNGETYEGKPWMTLNMNRWDDLKGNVTFSSYLEYRRNLDKIPKRHMDIVVNKEDFNYIAPVVIQPKEDTFTFLTETELNELSNEQYKNYKIEYEENSMLNNTKHLIHEENIQNDNYTRMLEETVDTEEESLTGDDY